MTVFRAVMNSPLWIQSFSCWPWCFDISVISLLLRENSVLCDTDVYNLCCNKLIWTHVNDLAALVLLEATLLMTSQNHMGLWSGDYTNLLPQFIMRLKVCPGKGLMRFEARLQPWQTPNRSCVLHGTRWETNYTDAHSGLVLCFHLLKHKQENANMMSSCRTVQILAFCVMIVVFHDRL